MAEREGPEFSNRQEFEEWLKDKHPVWAVVLAARAALRVLPLISHLESTSGFQSLLRNGAILSGFFSVVNAWSVASYPNEIDGFADGWENTLPGLGDFENERYYPLIDAIVLTLQGAALCSSSFVFPQARHNTPARMAGDSAHYAADAAIYVNADIQERANAWRILSEDAKELDPVEDPHSAASKLSRSELWLSGMPKWAEQKYQSFRVKLLSWDKSWAIWIDWYESRLFGLNTCDLPATAAKEFDLWLARQPSEWWQRGLKEVNTEVAIRVTEARRGDDDIRQTMSQFVLSYLGERAEGSTLDELVEAFGQAGYDSPRSSIRGRVNTLCTRVK